jgi:endonuclease-3
MEEELHQDRKAKALEAYDRLVAMQGYRTRIARREPMHELISTMLSHRTTGQNEALAYDRMWQRFGSWEAIRDAPLPELIEAIAPSNFAEAKAPNIQKTLTAIFEQRGEFKIDFLADLAPEEGLAWLLALPGVGIKTATLVLLFCFGKPLLPVDTHVHRVSQRLGLFGPKVNPTAAHPILAALLPHDAAFLYNYHVAFLRHGQRICTWSNPRCEQCPLSDICDWYAANVADQAL